MGNYNNIIVVVFITIFLSSFNLLYLDNIRNNYINEKNKDTLSSSGLSTIASGFAIFGMIIAFMLSLSFFINLINEWNSRKEQVNIGISALILIFLGLFTFISNAYYSDITIINVPELELFNILNIISISITSLFAILFLISLIKIIK